MSHLEITRRYTSEVNDEIAYYVDFIDGSVACFFIISGYFSNRQSNLLTFTKKQTTRLLIPFLIFSTTYAVLLPALNKGDLSDGLYKTLILSGAGMQLYFLPFLLFVTLCFAALRRLSNESLWPKVCIAVSIILIAICLTHPTSGSTGSNPKLLPLYFLAYIIGYLYKQTERTSILLLSAILLCFIGVYDTRFLDLTGMLLLFAAAEKISSLIRSKRAMGSGGVYLLHTPIINFSISIMLAKFGVTQFSNVVFSVLATYLVCLAVSICFMKFMPRYRWLLLE